MTNLKAWRLRLGYTQNDLAITLGVSRSTWIRYEVADYAPKWCDLLVAATDMGFNLRTTDGGEEQLIKIRDAQDGSWIMLPWIKGEFGGEDVYRQADDGGGAIAHAIRIFAQRLAGQYTDTDDAWRLLKWINEQVGGEEMVDAFEGDELEPPEVGDDDVLAGTDP